MIRMWSRHSRRSVPMKRSAIAFARGARIGVRMTRMSAPAKTASKAVNLLSRRDARSRSPPQPLPSPANPQRGTSPTNPTTRMQGETGQGEAEPAR